MDDLVSTGRDLAELESVIFRGQQTFVDVGRALLEIRQRRLYRHDFATFEDYCQGRWGWSRQRAHQLIGAAEVTSNLSTIVDIPLPRNEGQVRELSRIPEPEQRREVWREVVQEHGEHVTAVDVRQAVQSRRSSDSPSENQSLPAETPSSGPTDDDKAVDEQLSLASVGLSPRETTDTAVQVFQSRSELERSRLEREQVQRQAEAEQALVQEVIESSGPESDQKRVSRLRREFSELLHGGRELIAHPPEQYAEVFDELRIGIARNFLRDSRAWCDRMDSALREQEQPGLRMVGGNS